MDCRKTQALLTAFHDGELPDAERARVESHLQGCPECGRLLADLARADEVAGVPDPGPGYWERFNARLAERIEREAESPNVAVLRPKPGGMRQQLRYLVPAVAAAALVVMVVRYGGQSPVTPTRPPAESVAKPSALDPQGQRAAAPEQEPAAAKTTKDAAAARPAPAESYRAAQAPAAPTHDVGRKRTPTAGLEEKGGPAGRLPPDRIATGRAMPPAEEEGRPSVVPEERKKEVEAAPSGIKTQLAAKAASETDAKDEHASSPCEEAQMLASRGRYREAEAAQRECLARDPSPPTQEKGLLFLAELLDRQSRFAEADEVLTKVHQQFPKSRPLDLYRQQRPMVQKQQIPVPAIR